MVGHGLIFSRFGTTDLAEVITADGGFSEAGTYEGPFVSVRRAYGWTIGDYRLRLARADGDTRAA